MRLPSFFLTSALALLAIAASPICSLADSFSASYLAASVQTPSGVTTNINTFESPTYNSSTKTTTFNGSGITGTYTGSFTISAANAYGGAGGKGNFVTAANSYTLTLSSSVNYFGLWFSALDAGNQLMFYKDSTLLYSFTPVLYQSLVGACPNSNNAFCGNPNTTFLNQDNGEQFAYLNFYDMDGTFNKVVFSGSGFESDNHAVAYNTSPVIPLGTAIVTPEPSSWILLLTGICSMAVVTAIKRMRPARPTF